MYICIYKYTCVSMYMYICICICICICIYMYVHIADWASFHSDLRQTAACESPGPEPRQISNGDFGARRFVPWH